MAGKSRRGRGKRSSQNKKKKVTLARAVKQQPDSQDQKPVSPTDQAVPVVKEQTPVSSLNVSQSPSIITELRRIGILAGSILAILVVLAWLLS